MIENRQSYEKILAGFARLSPFGGAVPTAGLVLHMRIAWGRGRPVSVIRQAGANRRQS
jgi:hypothetical protein